jgi:hypothetical protein
MLPRARVATDTRRVAICSSTMVCSWCSFRLRLIIKKFIVLLDNNKLLSKICKYVLRIQRSLRWNQARGHNLADDERIVTKDCWPLSDLMVWSWTPGDHGNSVGWGQRWCTIRWCKFCMLLRRPVHLQQLHSTIASRLRKSFCGRNWSGSWTQFTWEIWNGAQERDDRPIRCVLKTSFTMSFLEGFFLSFS